MKLVKTRDGRNYLVPFLLVTSLFFLWGFAHSILDVLNKFFQNEMHLSKTQSAFIQVVVYGGYFLMALPAGAVIRRWGYRAGVLMGLFLYGIGALLFIPGAEIMAFPRVHVDIANGDIICLKTYGIMEAVRFLTAAQITFFKELLRFRSCL